MFSKSENVGMTRETRKEINRLTRHKRIQFEAKITKGVIAILNAQAERKILDSERQDFLRSLTSQSNRKKKMLTSATSVMKEASSTAPMGVGAASSALLTTANSVGNAILDTAEEKRQETDAKERFVSAQFMHYIPTSDYASIAKQVASILSYRFQFLIFRLAGGDEGYIKLANFFIESINAYAIERLRERKGDYVNALVDAAIPPASNARRYREWLEIDPTNFRIKLAFGYRKKLKLDEAAQALVACCSPAVRTFLGGHDSEINPTTSIEEHFNAYTIRGALYHAPTTNCQGEVMLGVETSYSLNQHLYGDCKYPMILLSRNETNAEIGIHTATNLTKITLQDAHVVALKRLVPDFFTHEASDAADEKSALTETAIPTYDQIEYTEEATEIPWTLEKDDRWKDRWKAIYSATKKTSSKENVVSISHSSALTAIHDKGHQFDEQLALNDAKKTLFEAKEKYNAVFESNDLLQRGNAHLEAIKLAKHLAISTKIYMNSLMRRNKIKQEDIKLCAEYVSFARITLSASFDLPLLELRKLQKLNQTFICIANEARHTNRLQAISYKNLQILVDSIQHFSSNNSLSLQEYPFFLERQKKIKSQFSDSGQTLDKTIKFAKMMTYNDHQSEAPSIDEFDEKATEVHALMTVSRATDNIQILKRKIELYQLETQGILFEINSALEHEEYLLEEDPCWLGESNASDFSTAEKIQLAKSKAQQAFAEIENHLRQAHALIENQTIAQRLLNNNALKQTLMNLLTLVKQQRDSCVMILSKIKLQSIIVDTQSSDEINPQETLLIKRLHAHHRFGIISMLATRCQDPAIQESMSILKDKLNRLYESNIENTLRSVETIFRDISIEDFDASDIESLHRRTVKTKKFIEEKQRLEQAIDCDIDASTSTLNRAKTIINDLSGMIRDEQCLNKNILSLLEDISSDVAEQDAISSPSKKTTKAIEDLIKIYSGEIEAPSDDSEEQSILDPLQNYTFIHQTLNQIIENNISDNISAWITEEEIKRQIVTYLTLYLKNYSREVKYSPDDWGFWLIANMIQWTTQKILSHEKLGIKACLDRAEQELTSMKAILNEELSELNHKRQGALKEIRTAYVQIKQASKAQRILKPTEPIEIVEADIISDALTWATNPIYSERKWLEERNAKKHKVKFLTIENNRSPIILLTFLLIAYFSDKVDAKRADIGRLYKLSSLHKQCARLLFRLQETPAYKENRKKSGNDIKTSTLQLMERVIDTKREQAEAEKAEIQETRENILAQRLSIFFNEWKKKTHDPEAVSQLDRAKKAAIPKQASEEKESIKISAKKRTALAGKAESKDVEPQRPEKKEYRMFETQVKKTAENYTIQEIEAILTDILHSLNTTQMIISQQARSNSRQTLYQSTLSDRSSEESLTLGSPSLKRTSSLDEKRKTVDRLTLNI